MKLSCGLLVGALQVLAIWAELKLSPRPNSPDGFVHDLSQTNKPLVLTCEDTMSIEEANLEWWKGEGASKVKMQAGDNVSINRIGKKLVLRMFSPSKTTDAGYYTCTSSPEEGLGEPESASIFILFYTQIIITSEALQYPVRGTDAKINCTLKDSSEQPTITWLRNKQQITNSEKYKINNDHLLVRNIDFPDGGSYTCNVDNFEMGDSATLAIDVTVTEIPTFNSPILLQPVPIVEGNLVTMTCQADGVPPPQYVFSKRNTDGVSWEELAKNANGQYEIQDVKRTDEGTYRCLATNQAGNQHQDTELDIYIIPVIEEPSKDKFMQEEDNELIVPCVATGDPAPNLSWRRRGSQADFPTQPPSQDDIYVRETAAEPEFDSESKIYRRTLELVIPSIKAKDAGDYVCKASNTAKNDVQMTFVIDVRYKPNFTNQTKSNFYGWMNSNTRITCIANGNPQPSIRWLRNGQELNTESGAVITKGDTNAPTQAISHLQRTVNNNNIGSVFGIYTCEASNNPGTNSLELHFKEAVKPRAPTFKVTDRKATYLTLRLAPPSDDGGQPVHTYLVTWAGTTGQEGEKRHNVTRVNMSNTTIYVIRDLTPNTNYMVRVYAINNVGMGEASEDAHMTPDVSRPDPVRVVSAQAGVTSNSYTLRWEVVMNGGAEISNYIVEYVEALQVDTTKGKWEAVRVSQALQTVNVEGEDQTQAVLGGLKRNTYYQASIYAVNRIGKSLAAKFVFQTGKGDGTAVKEGGASLGAGGIIGLILVLLLVLLLAVDAAFCKTKQCGLLWTISKAMGKEEQGPVASGKSPEEGDEASAKLLAKEKEDTLRTENEVAKETEGVQETEPIPEEKKELEPEEKEEKPVDVAVEEAVKVKTPTITEATPIMETAPETPAVQGDQREAQPAEGGQDKSDAPVKV